MPRQAAAAQGFSTGTNGTRALLKPPEDLDRNERTEFVSLIAGAAPSHFLPSDVPLIAAYAKAIVAERRAASELDREPVVSSPTGDRPSPWLAVWVSKCRAMTTLSRMLSLSPGGRVPSKSPEPEAPLSYFQKLALEKRNGEPEPN